MGRDITEKRRMAYPVAVAVGREDRRKIEAETIDMHLLNPIAEAIQNEAADCGVIGIEGVPTTAEVQVGRRRVLIENVVGAVIDAAKAQGRPVLTAFGSVIEDNVKNDLDACAVKGLNHVAELVDWAVNILTRAVGPVRREEGDRLISPVVDQSARAILSVELKDR